MLDETTAQVLLEFLHHEAWQAALLLGPLAKLGPVRLRGAVEHRLFRAPPAVAHAGRLELAAMLTMPCCLGHEPALWPGACQPLRPAISALWREQHVPAANGKVADRQLVYPELVRSMRAPASPHPLSEGQRRRGPGHQRERETSRTRAGKEARHWGGL